MELKKIDQKVFKLLEEEKKRQVDTLVMIPSENYMSEAVLSVLGSVFSNKYSEGYPGNRYYQGNEVYDNLENLAIERAKELYDVEHVNVQPYSGSVANAAIYMALLQPGDTLMGMKLKDGGHLSHGHDKVTFAGTYFRAVHYGVGEDGYIDYEEVAKIAREEKPKLIVCGYSAYPRLVDFAKFSKIANEVGAWLVADISHISGLVVGKMHPTPVQSAHIIMTTTHKTLRGPRGAMIMVTRKGVRKMSDLPQKIDKAVFPGIQGGPHNNQIAALAVALAEAKKSPFKLYARKIVQNANVLAGELVNYGWNLVTGGTDTHLLLADVRAFGVSGKVAAVAMEIAGMVMNANAIPGDPNGPLNPSGLRFGTPAITTRNMTVAEMKLIAGYMNEVMEVIRDYGDKVDGLYQNKKLRDIGNTVAKMARQYPVPGMEVEEEVKKD